MNKLNKSLGCPAIYRSALDTTAMVDAKEFAFTGLRIELGRDVEGHLAWIAKLYGKPQRCNLGHEHFPERTILQHNDLLALVEKIRALREGTNESTTTIHTAHTA